MPMLQYCFFVIDPCICFWAQTVGFFALAAPWFDAAAVACPRPAVLPLLYLTTSDSDPIS